MKLLKTIITDFEWSRHPRHGRFGRMLDLTHVVDDSIGWKTIDMGKRPTDNITWGKTLFLLLTRIEGCYMLVL